MDNQVFNFKDMQKTLIKDMRGDLNRDWIPGAVSMRTLKEIVKDEDGTEKTVYKFIYTMGDGSIQEVVREFDEIKENKADDRAYAEQLNTNEDDLKNPETLKQSDMPEWEKPSE